MSDETLLEFPCDFPIKIMGRESAEFQTLARSLVEKHTGPLTDDAVVSSLSRNGTFVSVTVTVVAQSQEQLDNIYRELTSNDEVLMAL
ncbi:MAG: YbeD family protein [Woeseiaceae bacterium]